MALPVKIKSQHERDFDLAKPQRTWLGLVDRHGI